MWECGKMRIRKNSKSGHFSRSFWQSDWFLSVTVSCNVIGFLFAGNWSGRCQETDKNESVVFQNKFIDRFCISDAKVPPKLTFLTP